MIPRRLVLVPALALAVLGAACAPNPTTTAVPAPALQPRAAAAPHFPADEDLQVMLRYLVEDGETPGIVLGILEADGSTRVLTYGTGGPGTRPLGPKSLFEIGSINKTFTGTLLADMVARGEVALSDPVAKYLPEGVTVPSRGGRQITLLDLATHSSGLPRMPDNFAPADPSNPYADYSAEQLYAFLSGHQLRRDVGSQSEYSNLGLGLLGHALARAAGKSLAELIRERITDPLGMEMTAYTHEGEEWEWMTKGHDDVGNVVPHWTLTDVVAGAGGLRSNAEDLLAYLKANVGPAGTDLERAMREAHRGRHQAQSNVAMGLAWQVVDHEGRTIVTHGGGTAGFRTDLAFDPEKRVGYVQLTNSGGFEDDLGMDFLLRGPPLAIPEVAVAREVLAAYAGQYQLAPGRLAVVKLEDDGTLTLRVPQNVRFRMYAESDTKFFVKRAPWRMTFTKDASGGVAGLVLDMNGVERTAPRVADAAPVAGAAAPAGVRDLPLTPADVARYEGTYLLGSGARTLELRVYAQDGRLMAQAAGQEPTRLRYQGEHAFVPDFDDEVLLVFTVENGRAGAVTLHQNGAVVPGTRKP